MTTKTNEILPIAWNHGRRANEFSLVIMSNQPQNSETHIHLEVVAVEPDEDGEIFYSWNAEMGAEILAEGGGCDSPQEAADDAAELLAAWMQNEATSVEMMRFVDVMGDGSARQVELAEILGTTQATVSRWLDGSKKMAKPVRTHIMRMMGIRRTPGAGGTAKWAFFK